MPLGRGKVGEKAEKGLKIREDSADRGSVVDGLERRVRAFGEERTVEAWAEDSRAAVYGELILRRLDAGMTPEQAIATPTAALERGPVKLLAFGERKTLRDWADDVRCAVSLDTLRGRLDADWNPERAIETPSGGKATRPITAWARRRG